MPVYRKGPEEWRVRVWWQGKRRDWIVRGPKRDALRFEAERKLELQRAEPLPLPTRGVPTFSDYCAAKYGPWLRGRITGESWRVRTHRLAALRTVVGDVRMDGFDFETIEGYKSARLGAGRAPSTINDEIKALAAVVNHARATGLNLPKPRFKMLKTRGRPGRVKCWTADEVAAILGACERTDPTFLFVLVTMFNTGCRRTEVLRLRARDVDLEAGVLWVQPSEEWTPKDREARAVPVSAALRPWLQARLDAGADHLALSKVGRPFRAWPGIRFKAVLAAAKVSGSAHVTRHTYASHYLRNGGDLYTLSKILGHSDVRLTQEVYGHLVPGAVAESASRVSFAPGVGPATVEAKARWKA